MNQIQRRIGIVVLLGSVLFMTGCPGAPPTPVNCSGCDLTITNLEVTQAIQTTSNSIQLVAQRTTGVRATIGISGVSQPVSGVTGRLHVFVDGTEITPASGIVPFNGPFTAPLSPQRANANDTLNFVLPAPTGITASSNVKFQVDITPVAGETNTSNNSLSTGNLTVVNRTTPSIFFTRIDYTPSGSGLSPANLVAPKQGDAFVRGILPVNDADPNLYRQGMFPSITYAGDENRDGRLNALGADGNLLLSLISTYRQLIVINGAGAANNTFLFGWIADNPIDGNGLGQVPGFSAFGNTELTRGQRSFAHELTHNFGLNHNTNPLDQVGWDVGARLEISSWVGNNVTDSFKPTTLSDIQVAGLLTKDAWIDTTNYNFLLSSPILARAEPSMVKGSGVLMSPAVQQNKSERVAVVQGIFDPSGEKLLELKPVLRLPWPSEPTLERSGPYIVEITDDAGSVTRTPFNALIADDPDQREEHEINGFFEVMVAVPPDREIVKLRITDSSGRREYGGLAQSKLPAIRILSPSQGAQLGANTEVQWEVTDSDTPPSQLRLHVAYSPDAGKNWVPIAADIRGTEKGITFDSTQIQQSKESGVIRVFVTDGLNTVFADVQGLSTTAAQFPPP